MNFDWLKRYMPRGLYGRAALILMLPIITLQLVVSVVFIQRHFEDVTRQMTRALVLDLGLLQVEIDTSNSLVEATARVARLAGPLRLGVALPATRPKSGFNRKFYDLSGRVVFETLQARLPSLIAVDLVHDPRAVTLWLDTAQGAARIVVGRERVSASNPHQFLVLMLFVGALMTLVAFLYLRNQLRPIKRLARAAEAFGRGRIVKYQPAGAIEVRAAGSAFLNMRARIERQIEQRTMMLSGVSHDLRTPLTRLKLGLSMVGDDPEIRALKGDVEDMERLLDEFLAFSRGDALDDPAPTDLRALLGAITEAAARSGENVQLGDVSVSGDVTLRPMAIRRAVENLIGNALRHGSRALVSAVGSERSVTISVEDDGPGVPAEQREKAQQPFVRLDEARSQNRGGGVGLGLSITRDIARSHGGTLRLGDSTLLGGLKADIVLPR